MAYFPYYQFPSTVVLIDDVESVLIEVARLFEDSPHKTRIFTNQQEALDFINNSGQKSEFVLNLEGSSDSYDDLYEAHKEIYNPQRFDQISCVVVDYDMPGINGLDLCAKITDKRIKKILLTGVADEQIVISAFNRGLIDYFIRKHDVNSPSLVTEFIRDATLNFFHEATQSAINTAIKHSSWSESPLKNNNFRDFFAQTLADLGCLEHYLLDVSGIFIALDATDSVYLIQTFSKNTLLSHIKESEQAPFWNELSEGQRKRCHDGELAPLLNPISHDSPYTLGEVKRVKNEQDMFVVICKLSMNDTQKIVHFNK